MCYNRTKKIGVTIGEMKKMAQEGQINTERVDWENENKGMLISEQTTPLKRGNEVIGKQYLRVEAMVEPNDLELNLKAHEEKLTNFRKQLDPVDKAIERLGGEKKRIVLTPEEVRIQKALERIGQKNELDQNLKKKENIMAQITEAEEYVARRKEMLKRKNV